MGVEDTCTYIPHSMPHLHQVGYVGVVWFGLVLCCICIYIPIEKKERVRYMTVWRGFGYDRTRRGNHHIRDWLFSTWAKEVKLDYDIYAYKIYLLSVAYEHVFYIHTFRTNLPLQKQRRGDLYQLVDVQRLNSEWLLPCRIWWYFKSIHLSFLFPKIKYEKIYPSSNVATMCVSYFIAQVKKSAVYLFFFIWQFHSYSSYLMPASLYLFLFVTLNRKEIR